MPAFTYLIVPEGPSCETQPGSTEHLIPHQTRPGFFTESPQGSTRGYKPQHASSLQASAWMMSAVVSLVQRSRLPGQNHCGRMIQVADTERRRSLEPFYINLPRNLFSRPPTEGRKVTRDESSAASHFHPSY